MLQTPIDQQESQNEIWTLVEELFPIHRTLVNDGYGESLEIIQKVLNIEVLEYASGEKAWDWIIPNAWDVNVAYVEDSKGNRLIDFAINNLHLSQYSIAFSGKVSKEELFDHLKYLVDLPDAIPYNYLYYRTDWEFNIAYSDLDLFVDDEYYVHIDVNDRPGMLRVGEYYLAGETEQEIIFSTYLCHPSMANDNLSGVVTLVELFKHLHKIEKRKYSYRLIIVPETVGPIAYLANNEHIIGNIVGGFSVYDCGDKAGITYKKTYAENSFIDRTAMHVLKHNCDNFKVQNWDPRGSDERQYNAPGLRLPVGSIMRSPAAEYKEYHTFYDTLTNISKENLYDTANLLYKMVVAIEMDGVYQNLYTGEPFFSKYSIEYPSFHEDHHNENSRAKYYVKILASELDGKNSLLDIAEKWDIPIEDLHVLLNQFIKEGLASAKLLN